MTDEALKLDGVFLTADTCGYILPFGSLERKKADRVAQFLSLMGLDQLWVEFSGGGIARAVCAAPADAASDPNYFLAALKAVGALFRSPLLIYKRGAGEFYKTPAEPGAGPCRFEPVDVPAGAALEEALAAMLGAEPARVGESVPAKAGLKSAMAKSNIMRELSLGGAAEFPDLFEEPAPAPITPPSRSELWKSCPAGDGVGAYFDPAKPLVKLEFASGGWEREIAKAGARLILQWLGIAFVLARKGEAEAAFLQEICPLEIERAFANILRMASLENIPATEGGKDLTAGYSAVLCEAGDDALDKFARRAEFNGVIRYFPHKLAEFRAGAARDLAMDLAACAAGASALYRALLPQKCACLDARDAKPEIAAALGKTLSDAGYSGATLSFADKPDKTAFLIIHQGDEPDSDFLRLIASSIRALAIPRFLYRGEYGPLLETRENFACRYVANVLLDPVAGANGALDAALGLAGSELVAAPVPSASGMRRITKRALLFTALEEYGKNGVAKALDLDADPEPF